MKTQKNFEIKKYISKFYYYYHPLLLLLLLLLYYYLLLLLLLHTTQGYRVSRRRQQPAKISRNYFYIIDHSYSYTLHTTQMYNYNIYVYYVHVQCTQHTNTLCTLYYPMISSGSLLLLGTSGGGIRVSGMDKLPVITKH